MTFRRGFLRRPRSTSGTSQTFETHEGIEISHLQRELSEDLPTVVNGYRSAHECSLRPHSNRPYASTSIHDPPRFSSGGSISTVLSNAATARRSGATPEVKIDQAQTEVMALARNQPYAWIIELGTDDAGANHNCCSLPFLAGRNSFAPASRVIYVTTSAPSRAGGNRDQYCDPESCRHASRRPSARLGQRRVSNPSWVSPDHIHPTPQDQAALANLETQELQRACGAV